MFRLVLASALVALSCAESPGPYAPAPYAPAPAYKPAPSYGQQEHYDESPKPYAFQYGVQDDYTGANFNQQEQADQKGVSGSYQVHLPDGRIQTVTYQADWVNGYIADVKYEGTPVYPKYEPKPYAPAPAPYKPAPAPYAPAPVYKPAPSYPAPAPYN